MYIQQLNLPPPQPFLSHVPETNLLDVVGVVADNRWLIAGVTALALNARSGLLRLGCVCHGGCWSCRCRSCSGRDIGLCGSDRG